MATLGCIACALSKMASALLYALAPSDRIGEVDPPGFVFWFNLYEMTGNRCGHVPFLRRDVESNTCSKNLGAGLVLGLDLFESQRRIVEHSKLKIAARSKDMPLPVTTQGIGDSWRKTKSAFVATQTTSRKAPAVTASIMSDQK